MLQGCTLQGAKRGLLGSGQAQALLLDTRVEKCGRAGVQVMDRAVLTCTRHGSPLLQLPLKSIGVIVCFNQHKAPAPTAHYHQCPL